MCPKDHRAWPHKDGKGFAIDLNFIPHSRRLVLPEPKNKEDIVQRALTMVVRQPSPS